MTTGMVFAVETWAPAYGSAVGDELEPAPGPVDAAVELAVDQWAPLTPPPSAAVDTVVFVDGVRRVDARLWITGDDGIARPALCASVAAGAVRCEPGGASLVAVAVERGLHSAAAAAEDVPLGRWGTYIVQPAAGDDERELSQSVQNHMTRLEGALSETLNGTKLVVFDGPLGLRADTSGVGYVKTQHVQYLDDPALQRVVTGLDAGQRTPLFAIGGRLPRWSWYLRLPGPRAHGLSGIVRLELPALGDGSCAAHRADQVSATLPRFASQPHKEPRAPQNLYPIAGLEQRLRHRLGDPMLLERALRRASAAAGRPGARTAGVHGSAGSWG